jgi:hypothetical protein
MVRFPSRAENSVIQEAREHAQVEGANFTGDILP